MNKSDTCKKCYVYNNIFLNSIYYLHRHNVWYRHVKPRSIFSVKPSHDKSARKVPVYARCQRKPTCNSTTDIGL